jgi:hypothetical protein
MRTIAGVAAIAAMCTLTSHAAPATPPKLAVIIVVDQMRADYVDRFNGEWTGGLKRMVTQGAWFQQAAYPYLTTVTCAGHATIATGSFPHTHGVFQNAWWDREARRQMTCTQDPKATNIGYGVAVTGGDSAYRLQVPTFTDQMRTARQAHVAAISLKDRSAVMLAGHGGDAVAWLTNTLDGWESSTVYSETPVPAIKAFVEANPIAGDFGKTWDRMLPAASYSGPDDGMGEAPPQGWTRSFPHPLNGASGKADGTFFAQWERSPFADAYLGRFAASLVGRERWVVGLSSDHGVTAIPEQLVAEGKDGGRIDGGGIYNAIEDVLHPVMTQGRHVTAISTNDIYFEPGVYDTIRKSRELTAKVRGAIEARPGVQRVFLSEEIRDGAKSNDPLVRAAALSYFPGRSGDIVFAPKPGWMISTAGTTHGSATPDDQRVPIMFLGAGIKAGKYQEAATPADIAPTLAAIVGLSMKAEGHALSCVQ